MDYLATEQARPRIRRKVRAWRPQQGALRHDVALEVANLAVIAQVLASCVRPVPLIESNDQFELEVLMAVARPLERSCRRDIPHFSVTEQPSGCDSCEDV